MNSSFRHLEAAAVEDNIEALEKHRETASTLCKTLSDFLLAQASSTDDIHHWHQELTRLADGDHGGPAETLIMAVGNMGAGKSTAVNALLGEPRLLPTSGYDACTSVATEVRYNHSEDPDEAYRAEITFITEEELLEELHILREDVLSIHETEDGSAADDDNSPAEVAWDKIQAVWPLLTRAELAWPEFDLRALLEDPLISVCLGKTQQVCHPTAARMCKDLKRFVANRDNASLAKRAGNSCAEQQLWPLVEKVSIFVKSDVLSTGAVIRDMPGSQDGNSARSARAAADGDKCDHLCVFVPIKRAISEQIVKKPFNDSSTFKNWIKFDGRLGDITYVCTMTDDAIEIERDAEEFGLVEHLEEFKRLEEGRDSCEATLADLREQLDALQVNSQVLEDTVESLIKSAGDKRKKIQTPVTLRDKRLKRSLLPLSLEGGSYTANLDLQTTEDTVETLPSDPKADEADEVADEAKEVAKQIQSLEVECEALHQHLMHHVFFLRKSCMQARNNLTRSAIKRDFVNAAGELLSRQRQSTADVSDQESDAEDRIEPQPPTVHTVSATGYFESLKRHSKGQFWSLNTAELSGIPAWRDHIKQLTVPARRRKYQGNLKAVLRCFNHLAIWCDNGSGISLNSEQEKEELARYKQDLDLCIERLGTHFDGFVRACRRIFDWLFSTQVRAVLPDVIDSAIEVASMWPSRKKGDQLLVASSYRAACRKGGIYEGKGRVKKTPWDLNGELVQPLMDGIDDQWNTAFVKFLPAAFKKLKFKTTKTIEDLTNDVDQRMQCNMTESARRKLRVQMEAQIERICELFEEMKATLIGNDTRGKMRKQLESAMKHEMSRTWKECVETIGVGSFQRQQAIVDRHIRDRGEEMYTCASSRVERIFSSRCDTMAHDLHTLKGSVDKELWHAYTTSIVVKEDGNREMREELRRLLVEADDRFQNS